MLCIGRNMRRRAENDNTANEIFYGCVRSAVVRAFIAKPRHFLTGGDCLQCWGSFQGLLTKHSLQVASNVPWKTHRQRVFFLRSPTGHGL